MRLTEVPVAQLTQERVLDRGEESQGRGLGVWLWHSKYTEAVPCPDPAVYRFPRCVRLAVCDAAPDTPNSTQRCGVMPWDSFAFTPEEDIKYDVVVVSGTALIDISPS